MNELLTTTEAPSSPTIQQLNGLANGPSSQPVVLADPSHDSAQSPRSLAGLNTALQPSGPDARKGKIARLPKHARDHAAPRQEEEESIRRQRTMRSDGNPWLSFSSSQANEEQAE